MWVTAVNSVAALGIPLPAPKLIGLVAVLWWLCLSQLRVLWIVWLPFYIVLYPPMVAIIALVSGTWAIGQRLYRNQNSTSAPVSKVDTAKIRRLPIRLLWVVGIVIWFVFFSDETAPWARWIPTFLLAPVWVWTLRIAYSNTIRPTTFAEGLFGLAVAALDRCTSDIEEARNKGKDDAPLARFWCRFATFVLNRYHTDCAATVIQRETLLSFSIVLVVAFGASCLLWGLVAYAVIGSDPQFFTSYAFFNSASLVECLVWTFGCMTTTIDYPGTAASVTVKLLHTLLLAMGLFHLTYLLLGFSVMASAEMQRSAARTASEYESLMNSRNNIQLQLDTLKGDDDVINVTRST